MGLFSWKKPRIKVQSTKKDGFSGWIKCSGCHELIHATELQKNILLCPKCGYHYRLPLFQRISLLSDENSFEELFTEVQPADPLEFVDTESYPSRIQKVQQKTQRDEAIAVGKALIHGRKIALAVLDFSFMGGSMGSVVGERLTLLIEYAIKNTLPLVIVSASGGARMQESTLSLMQMVKTSAALRRLAENKVPYISILTNPTMGGVTASFASLGDIIMAEPDALIGFAGPRVVEQTIGQKLPPKAQKAEFLLEKGMIDIIVKRDQMKDKLSFFLEFLSNAMQPEKDQTFVSKLKQMLESANKKEKNLV